MLSFVTWHHKALFSCLNGVQCWRHPVYTFLGSKPMPSLGRHMWATLILRCHESPVKHFRASASGAVLLQTIVLALQCHHDTWVIWTHTSQVRSVWSHFWGEGRREGGLGWRESVFQWVEWPGEGGGAQIWHSCQFHAHPSPGAWPQFVPMRCTQTCACYFAGSDPSSPIGLSEAYRGARTIQLGFLQPKLGFGCPLNCTL